MLCCFRRTPPALLTFALDFTNYTFDALTLDVFSPPWWEFLAVSYYISCIFKAMAMEETKSVDNVNCKLYN